MNAIEFRNVSKKFKKGESFDSLRDFIPNLLNGMFGNNGKKDELQAEEFWALKDVSFEVKKGEVIGIIGPNGAGKSTVLKLLSKILKPTHGDIEINGRLSALIEVGAGFHPDMTGRENVYFNGAIMGMKKNEIDKKFDSILDFSGIRDFIDTPVKRYSSGMYVRLGFAVAAHLDPDILLVDEILAVGDASFQKKCLGKMKDVVDQGRTVVFVSHNMEAVLKLCSKCILIKKGVIEKFGATTDVVRFYYRALTDKTNENAIKNDFNSNSPIIIENISLFNQYKETYKFDIMDTITVRAEFKFVRQYEDPIFLGMQIRTAMGLPVFTSTNVDVALEQNSANIDGIRQVNGHAEIDIPSQLLNSGTYEIHLVAFEPGGTLRYLVSNIYFEVFDNGSWVSKIFTTQRQGITLTKLPWKIEYATTQRPVCLNQ